MNIAIILSGGRGTRMGCTTPKQQLLLCSKPVLLHSLETFENHPQIDAIYVVGDCTPMPEITKLRAIVVGGNSRSESSLCGLNEVARDFSGDDIVLIHDAARPLVSEKIITYCIQSAIKYGAATTALPITDTILVANGEVITGVVDRTVHFAAQTPQAFRLSLIMSVRRDDTATDDATLVLNSGHPVHMVMGEKRNMKLTTMDDMALLEQFVNIKNPSLILE